MKKIIFLTVIFICICIALTSCNEKTLTTICIEGKSVETTTEAQTSTTPQIWEVSYDEIIAPNGNVFQINDGARSIWEEDNQIVLLTYNTLELFVGNNNELKKNETSSPVLQYTVAHGGKLYWYNLKKEVWVLDLQTLAYQLFCENAIAVSPHIDEAQGAVVEQDRANCDGCGIPVYSPYGIK